MILEDQLVAMRLKDQPEFLLRLQEVLTNWRLSEKPGLVVQARPVQAAALDVGAVKVRTTLRDGIETDGPSNYWGHFEASDMYHNVHGITSTVNIEVPPWLMEVHRDGHMLAGIWDFPDMTVRNEQVTVIAYWYASFFEEAFRLIGNVAAAGGVAGEFYVTATLLGANALRYGARSPADRPNVTGEQSHAQNVQWTVQRAVIGSPEWQTLARAMAQGIAGAYRASLR